MDTATGLLYVGNGQYFDPSTGRFLNLSLNPGSTNPYVPWGGEPIGALIGPLVLLAMLYSRKKRRGKLDNIVILLVLVVSLSLSLAACVGTPAPGSLPQPSNQNESPPTPIHIKLTTTSEGGAIIEYESNGKILGTTPVAAGTPLAKIIGTACATPPPTPTPTSIPEFSWWSELWNYIEFINVPDEAKPFFIEAVTQVANAFGSTLGREPAKAFIDVFRLSPAQKFKFEIGPCSACAGAGGYTHNARWIEFAEQNPFYDATMSKNGEWNRSPEMAYDMNVHNVVHELGHAFANLWAFRNNKGEIEYVDASPYRLSFPDSRFLTNEGFVYPGPDYQTTLWRMHPDVGEDDIIRQHEAFADMFLGWTYGGVGFIGDLGTKRLNLMNQNMPNWLMGNPAFP